MAQNIVNGMCEDASLPLDVLLGESDFVSLHCPLNEQTRGLIGAPELARMKPTAYLINLSRGPVVHHDALVLALASHQIAGAGIDVFYQEPLPPGDPITGLDNVVLSPHWLTGTIDVYQEASSAVCRAMLEASQGCVPTNVVNRDVIERPGFQAKLARFRA